MVDREPQRHDNDFLQLNIFRRLGGEELKRFIDRSRKAAQVVLGEQITTSLRIDDEIVPAGLPYAEVTRAGDLTLDMLHIRDVPESRSDQKFRNLRRNFVNGFPPRKSKDDREPRPSVFKVMESMAREREMDNDGFQVVCRDIGTTFRPGVKNGYYDLSLLPDMSDDGWKLILDQSIYLWERLPVESRGLAYPTPDDRMLSIPFASVRRVDSVDSHRERDFLDSIRTALPVTVIVGGPELET